jgi:hypothetical protein
MQTNKTDFIAQGIESNVAAKGDYSLMWSKVECRYMVMHGHSTKVGCGSIRVNFEAELLYAGIQCAV